METQSLLAMGAPCQRTISTLPILQLIKCAEKMLTMTNYCIVWYMVVKQRYSGCAERARVKVTNCESGMGAGETGLFVK
jgi:hypothetical protein